MKKGDYYKVIYDAKYVDDEFVGIGDFQAVLMNHKSNDYRFFINDRLSCFNIWICSFITEDVE